MIEWRVVVGWPNYEVSADGRVRNVSAGGRPVAVFTGKDGYPRTNVWRNGEQRVRLVHRLMAAAFLRLPDGMTVNHKDGDPANNVLENLEVVTQAANNLHKTRVLGRGRGSDAGGAKLREEDIPVIRERLVAGATQRSIAAEYGCCRSNISRIKTRANWGHV